MGMHPAGRTGGRALAALALAGTLAACAAHEPPPDGAAAIRGFAATSRVIGRRAAYVEVAVLHQSRRYRLERVVLVTPGGREIAPESTRRDVVKDGGHVRPHGAFGIGTGGIGIAIGLPLLLGRPADTYRYRAMFPVPAPRAYRRGWSGWRVVIHMRRGRAAPLTIVRPAPAPDI